MLRRLRLAPCTALDTTTGSDKAARAAVDITRRGPQDPFTLAIPLAIPSYVYRLMLPGVTVQFTGLSCSLGGYTTVPNMSSTTKGWTRELCLCPLGGS